MSQHSSLRGIGGKGVQHRSVLKRYERIRILQEQGRWKEGDSVFGLAKVRTIRVSAKKERKVVEEEGAPAEGGTEKDTSTEGKAEKEK